jgi:hypothetical protein
LCLFLLKKKQKLNQRELISPSRFDKSCFSGVQF